LLVVSVCYVVGGRCGGVFNRKAKVFGDPMNICVEKIANAVVRWTEDGEGCEEGLVFLVRKEERNWDVEI